LTFRFDQNNINDIDFHFRFTFQFIKRQLADTMKLFVDQVNIFFSKKNESKKKKRYFLIDGSRPEGNY